MAVFARMLLVAWVMFAASKSLLAAPRVWTDITGQFKVRAELVAVDAENATLRTDDGRSIQVPLSRLSAADRRFLAAQHEEETGPGESADSKGAPRYGEPETLTLIRGLKLATPGGARGVTATFPAPAIWPEQAVEVVDKVQPSSVRSLSDRTLPGGSQQMVVSIPTLRAGEETEVRVSYRVLRRPILPPEDPTGLRLPEKITAELRPYLAASPGIQTRHAKIKATAETIAADTPSGWELARKTFDWVRGNLKYVGGDLKGALWAAEHGQGDCEEYTSLFIALARANGLPARAVWVPGHCYAEFYLEDASGRGYWFPCDLLAEAEPGSLKSTLPILQKGDSFKTPEHREAQRYLAETFSARDIGRGSPPTIQPILEIER